MECAIFFYSERSLTVANELLIIFKCKTRYGCVSFLGEDVFLGCDFYPHLIILGFYDICKWLLPYAWRRWEDAIFHIFVFKCFFMESPFKSKVQQLHNFSSNLRFSYLRLNEWDITFINAWHTLQCLVILSTRFGH